MHSPITLPALSTGSVYKLIAIGNVASLVPLCLLMGVFSLFGAETISWNGQPLTGITGLIASPFIGLFLALLFTGLFGSLCALGLWIYSKIGPLELEIKSNP